MLHKQPTASSASLVFKMSSENPQNNLILCFITWTKWVHGLCQSEEVSSPWGLKTFFFFFSSWLSRKKKTKTDTLRIFLASGKNSISLSLKQANTPPRLFSFYFFFASAGTFTHVLCLYPLHCCCSVAVTVLASWHWAGDIAVTLWAPIRVGENST